VPYVEKDVSRDQVAAQEMMRRSGQMGVPVITVDDQVIVGFDERRLEQLVGRPAATGPRLGAAVAPREGGLLVGRVHPGSAATQGGLQPGDVIIGVNGSSVTTADELQDSLSASWRRGSPARVRFRRDGAEREATVDAP
jgi:S1-C subfamily serine protease